MTDKILYLTQQAKDLYNLEIPQKNAEQLMAYMSFIEEKNTQLNLTAIRDQKDFLIKHLLDSMSPVLEIADTNSKMIDIGSGAGFPGIVLAIIYPDCQMTFVDSIGKKAAVIREGCDMLDLKNCTVVHSRAEDLANDRKYKAKFDYVLARAVSSLPELLPILSPFMNETGKIIAMKGQKAEFEIKQSTPLLEKFSLSIERVRSYTLPEELFARKLVVLTH